MIYYCIIYSNITYYNIIGNLVLFVRVLYWFVCSLIVWDGRHVRRVVDCGAQALAGVILFPGRHGNTTSHCSRIIFLCFRKMFQSPPRMFNTPIHHPLRPDICICICIYIYIYTYRYMYILCVHIYIYI